MNKTVIIGVYFGKFPEYFDLWLKSAEYNRNVDFLIFTDQKMKVNIQNIRFIEITIQDMEKLASKKLEIEINLKRPYKCCDYKPVYGIIFEDYIKKYEFWGHCDFDMIFGDILSFVTEEMLNKYDKILPLGHLSLYRNTTENNNRYKMKGSKTGEYKEVFSTDKSFAFDEIRGIYSIYKENNYPVYDKRIFADISMIYKRFRLALKDKNYYNQVFYWENGKVYRAYEENKVIKREEFIYIHFKKRKNMEVKTDNIFGTNSFYITYDGFIKKEIGLPTINDIRKYNKNRGKFFEFYELKKFQCKEILNKVIGRIKNEKTT